MKPILLAGAAAAALAACTTMTEESRAGGRSRRPPPRFPSPTTSCSPTGPGPSDGVPPFDQVRPELFAEAFQFAIDERAREVLAIADNPAAPTFANTVEALEKVGQRLDRVQSIFGVMTDNMTSPEYQAIEREWQPRLAAAFDEVILNPALFAAGEGGLRRARELRPQRPAAAGRHPALRPVRPPAAPISIPEQKQQLSAYNQELARLFAEFGEKLLADEQTHIVATEAQLAGVPADVKAAAAAAARERNLPAGQFAIVNTRSAVDPILTFADDRALRERVWRAFVNRGDNGDANDTNRIIAQIVKARADRARLLGFPQPRRTGGCRTRWRGRRSGRRS